MSPTNAVDDPVLATFGRLLEAANRLERDLGARMETESGLPHSWFEVLLRLVHSPEGRMSMGSLAEEVTLTTGGVTRLLDRMTSAGLVDRAPCASDRRVTWAVITPEGRRRVERAARAHRAALRDTFDSFSDTDLRRLDALLDRLR